MTDSPDKAARRGVGRWVAIAAAMALLLVLIGLGGVKLLRGGKPQAAGEQDPVGEPGRTGVELHEPEAPRAAPEPPKITGYKLSGEPAHCEAVRKAIDTGASPLIGLVLAKAIEEEPKFVLNVEISMVPSEVRIFSGGAGRRSALYRKYSGRSLCFAATAPGIGSQTVLGRAFTSSRSPGEAVELALENAGSALNDLAARVAMAHPQLKGWMTALRDGWLDGRGSDAEKRLTMAKAANGLCPDEMDFYRFLQRLSRHPNEAVRDSVLDSLRPRADAATRLPALAALSKARPQALETEAAAELLVLACTAPALTQGKSPVWLPALPLTASAVPRLLQLKEHLTPATDLWLSRCLQDTKAPLREIPMQERRELITWLAMKYIAEGAKPETGPASASKDTTPAGVFVTRLAALEKAQPENRRRGGYPDQSFLTAKALMALCARKEHKLNFLAQGRISRASSWKDPEYAAHRNELQLAYLRLCLGSERKREGVYFAAKQADQLSDEAKQVLVQTSLDWIAGGGEFYADWHRGLVDLIRAKKWSVNPAFAPKPAR